MKQIKKVFALLLAIVMLLGMTSCSTVGKWIVKTEKTEMPVGTYLVYETVYYQYSMYYVSDYTKSPLDQEITLEDESKTTGAGWIKDMAMESVQNAIAVLEECDKLGIKLSANEEELVREEVADTWDASVEQYERLGISKESLKVLQRQSRLSEKLFNYLYGNNGLDPVTDEDVKDYFEKDYSSIEYIRVSLLDADNKKLTTDQIAEIKDELDAMADEFSAGKKTFTKLLEEYNQKHTGTDLTSTSNICIVSEYFTDELVKVIKDCDENEAVTKEYSNYMYLIAKHSIKEETEEYLKENLDSLRHEMKDGDYMDYVEDIRKNTKFEINYDAVNKYSPKWMENKIS